MPLEWQIDKSDFNLFFEIFSRFSPPSVVISLRFSGTKQINFGLIFFEIKII